MLWRTSTHRRLFAPRCGGAVPVTDRRSALVFGWLSGPESGRRRG
jgi:hypothetical protein